MSSLAFLVGGVSSILPETRKSGNKFRIRRAGESFVPSFFKQKVQIKSSKKSSNKKFK
jgi:hypothetical protein